MVKLPQEMYQELMKVVSNRFDIIHALSKTEIDNYGKSEIAAFHGRKIIEAIAFGCLIGLENGLNHIPQDAKGQYNAETIVKSLSRKGIDIFPSPSIIRNATETERKEHNVNVVIDGIPERRIAKDELIKKYQRMHNWLHELNPYTKEGQDEFHKKNSAQLWNDLNEIYLFLQTHVISLKGKAFYCTLKDKNDGLTKIASLSRES